MIRRTLRKAIGFLASAGLAVGLLVFVGAWSLLATLVAQGEAASREVTSWAASHPLLEPFVRAVGLHQAFASHLFLGGVLLLGVSTAVCAWRRTKAALLRSRTLRTALLAGSSGLVESHDLEIPCGRARGEAAALSIVSDVLLRRGIRTKRRSDLLVAASAPWAVWGSPIFHWALVALILAVLSGQLLRSEGSMALAVTETKTDQPLSYVSVQAGPWHDWSRADRRIRLDALDPVYKTGGIDRGAVPTVSVLDGAGKVVVKQRVYPNNMLHAGSLAINAPAVGLSVWLASVDASGTETGRFAEPVDFSQTAAGGTVPVLALSRNDAAGDVMLLSVTVPLDRVAGKYGEWIPAKRTARVLVTTAEGKPLLDRVVRPDEVFEMPGGGAFRLLGIGWYSRLSLVDDPTIPYVYATMVLALLGLTMTLLFRQQLVMATVRDGSGGAVLLVRLRLWRNVPTSRSEIELELRKALGGEDEGDRS